MKSGFFDDSTSPVWAFIEHWPGPAQIFAVIFHQFGVNEASNDPKLTAAMDETETRFQ